MWKLSELISRLLFLYELLLQSQKLQMLAISNADISPGSVETQQMRVMAPKGVSIVFFDRELLRLLLFADLAACFFFLIETVTNPFTSSSGIQSKWSSGPGSG